MLKKLTVLLFTCILAASSVLAKSNPVPPAPLPSQITQAKKVFLLKGAGTDPYLENGSDVAFDSFYAEIKNWGRYQLVGSPAEADIVFELSYGSEVIGTRVWGYGGNVNSATDMDPKLVLTIYDPQTKAPIWNVVQHRDTARRQKNREKNLRKAVADMFAAFKARVEAQVQP